MKFRFLAIAIVAAALVASCKSGNKEAEKNLAPQPEKTAVKTVPALAFNPDSLAEEPVFDIVTSKGTLKVKLYKETPLHRANFIKLASERFYDNILFHRVIRGFMIQTGDPLTRTAGTDPKLYGTGGPGYTIPAEILPQFKHKKGALAAARRGNRSNPNKESSGSQFYIVEDAGACAQLDGEYTIFGETIGGMDVIDAIAAEKVSSPKNLPLEPVKIISVMPAE